MEEIVNNFLGRNNLHAAATGKVLFYNKTQSEQKQIIECN
jgi:hypothetical protein